MDETEVMSIDDSENGSSSSNEDEEEDKEEKVHNLIFYLIVGLKMYIFRSLSVEQRN